MSRSDPFVKALDSAEAQFAERGYHGVSMRQVAEGAGISVSLVQYHFKTKEALFSAVMERRIVAINHRRLALLDAVEVNCKPSGKPAVEDVLQAFLEPTVLLSRDKASGGNYYAQLIAQVTNDPQPHARNISRSFTDPIARQTLRVLHLALPELDRATLAWCYVFAVGSMIAAISPTGRVRLLSNNEADPDDVKTVMSLLVPFLTGAFERIAAMSKAGTLALTPRSLATVLPLPDANYPQQAESPTDSPPTSPSRRKAKPATAKSIATSKT